MTKTEKIEAFIIEWFKHFDVLDENEYFLQYLAPDVKMKFPDWDELIGHQGFNNWYNTTKALFVGNTTHDIKKVEITELTENKFNISLIVQMGATLKDESKLALTADETWVLSINEKTQKPTIHEYIVTF